MKPFIPLLIIVVFFYSSCKEDKKEETPVKLDYHEIVEEALHDSTTLGLSDSANLLDKNFYDPAKDSISMYLDSLESILEKDSLMVKKMGVNDSGILATNTIIDSLPSNPKDSFSNNIKKINTDEVKALKYNLKQIRNSDSMTVAKNTCSQIQCRVWARINKTDQRLYLYIDGHIVDTFKVSTGDKKHETPLFNKRPSGPMFQKYTSKKYPGGNYNGLGNMPYVVFIHGGYGVHGTTKGNIPKLGKKASHGCVRVHPDNAKIFFELVKKAGIQNTWVTIEN
ncbi:MAG: L,D-transpeptidase [Chitinophagaceae bacterium]